MVIENQKAKDRIKMAEEKEKKFKEWVRTGDEKGITIQINLFTPMNANELEFLFRQMLIDCVECDPALKTESWAITISPDFTTFIKACSKDIQSRYKGGGKR